MNTDHMNTEHMNTANELIAFYKRNLPARNESTAAADIDDVSVTSSTRAPDILHKVNKSIKTVHRNSRGTPFKACKVMLQHRLWLLQLSITRIDKHPRTLCDGTV